MPERRSRAPSWWYADLSKSVDAEDAFRILSIIPRPARGQTRIAFAVGTAPVVRLSLYDVLGRRVQVLADAPMFEGGPYEATLDAADLAPGLYFLRIEAGSAESRTEPLIVIR